MIRESAGVTTAALTMCAACVIGDDELPSTASPGVSDSVLLEVLVNPAHSSADSAVPIKVEARLRRQGSATACVALAVDGGKLEIPFGPGCRRAEGEPPEYRGAAHSLCEVSSTIRLSGLGADDSWIRGALLAALVPDAAEGSSTVFASLYDSAQCSGEAVAGVAKVVRFGRAVVPVNPEPGAADAAPPPDAAPPDSAEDGGPLPDGAPAPDAADGSP